MPLWNDLHIDTISLKKVREVETKLSEGAVDLDERIADLEIRRAENKAKECDLEEQLRALNAWAAEFSGPPRKQNL